MTTTLNPQPLPPAPVTADSARAYARARAAFAPARDPRPFVGVPSVVSK